MTYYSANHYAIKAEKSMNRAESAATRAETAAAQSEQSTGKIVQLGFDGAMQDGLLVFTHAPSGVEVPYELLDDYEYEIDLSYNSLEDLSNDVQMYVKNGNEIVTFVSALHRDSSSYATVDEMSSVMRFNEDTGYRWLFKAAFKIAPNGTKVFLLYPVIAKDVVLKYGAQEIDGVKTFNAVIKAKSGFDVINTSTTKGTNPTSTQYWGLFRANDGSGASAWRDTRLGIGEVSLNTNGNTALLLGVYKNEEGSDSNSSIQIVHEIGGNKYATCPTPASKTDNSTKIATTAWVANHRCTTQATTTSTASVNAPAYVVQNYKNGVNWYRVWSDGWIEQGGIVSNTKTNTDISCNLNKAYKDTTYILVIMPTAPNWPNGAGLFTDSKTTTKFVFRQDTYDYATGTTKFDWYACGY